MKLLLVDDEILIREGIKILLSAYSEIDVVGSCSNGFEAYEFCMENEVDIVLMDIRMDICDGVEGTKLIKSKFPDIKVLILTTFKDEAYIVEAMNNGASGYLLKNSSSDKIYEALRSISQGNVVMNSEIAKSIMQISKQTFDADEIIKKHDLTSKEIDMIKLVAEGLCNKEISDKLFLAEGTVKNNISAILSKLYLRDRTQLAIFAFKNNFL